MCMCVATTLFNLYQDYSQQYFQQHQCYPSDYHDLNSPSPCVITNTQDGEFAQWQAHQRSPAGSLTALAEALEVTFDPQLAAFYSHLFAGNLPVEIDGHGAELLQPWNEDDFVRLQQNITGHILMKRKLKQADTVFIGLTEQEDLLLSVKLADGGVYLERLGKEPHHKIADSIGELLTKVTVIV